MTCRSIFVVLLTLILVFACSAAFAADMRAKNTQRAIRAISAAEKTLGYSFAPEDHTWSTPGQDIRQPVGLTSYESSSASPGVPIGYSWYDYQQNGSMGRMIGTGPHSGNTGATIVHFSWMYLPDSAFTGRTYAYNAFSAADHSFVGATRIHDYDHQYSGYVNIDVTPDNRAVVGGHCDLLTGAQHYMAQMHFDACAACAQFDAYVRIPDSLAEDGVDDESAMWPKFFMQFGTDTVLHVITMNWDYYAPTTYYRNVGYEGLGVWDEQPYIIDSVQVSAHDITGERTGNRVAVAWMAGLNYQDPDCDTCSGLTLYDTYLAGQMDNDIYCQVSEDQGVTWEPRTNITKCPIGEAAYKGYCDLSILMDQTSNLHVVWAAVPWTEDTCLYDGLFCWFPETWWIDPTRIFHWSEDQPYIRTVVDATWLPSDSCGPPHFWSTQAAKMSISECDDKLYTIWTQFNDVPNGVDDDCSQWGYFNGHWDGTANGEIWLSVSSDGGMTWDAPRNLTNSYTPHCDPSGGGADCQSDYWASMTTTGRQLQTGEDWSGAVVVDPSGGSSPTDYYLDVQYVNDLDAGTIIFTDDPNGTWTYNPIKWFRLPCVEPIPAPNMVPQYWYIDDPAWAKPGVQLDTTLTLENTGNVELTYSITVEEDNGTSGWLTISGFSGSVSSGLDNLETGYVHLNTGGVQATTATLNGRLIFDGNDPSFPDTIEVTFIVADTLVSPVWFSVTTSCLSLAVSNHGNMGRAGIGGDNMDYYPDDCDTSANAEIYMYDGSVILGRDGGASFSSIFWGNDYIDEDGFRPQGNQIGTDYCEPINGSFFESGTFTTYDSTVAFKKVWVAPADDCEFIVEYLKVWSFDGGTHSGLAIGEAIDWDIPWDYLEEDADSSITAVNTGAIDPTRMLVYQSGYESDDQPDCQKNYDRFGGNAFVEAFYNGSQQPVPYGAFIGENDVMLAANEGFIESEMWTEMQISGFRGSDAEEDLFSMITYHNNLTIGASDTYEVVTILATLHEGDFDDFGAAIDRANAWYTAHGGIDMFVDEDDDGRVDVCHFCCQNMGDVDHNGQADGMDVVFMVDWLWNNGPNPPCMDEVNIDGVGEADPMDLVYFVDYLWNNGPVPVPCP